MPWYQSLSSLNILKISHLDIQLSCMRELLIFCCSFYYIISIGKPDKKNKPGFLFGVFLVILWGVRFFAEFVKERQNELDESFTLAIGQMLSIPFIIIGLYFIFRPAKSGQ